MEKQTISKDEQVRLRNKITEFIVGGISDFINVRVWWEDHQGIGECILEINIPFIAGYINVEITFAGITVAQFHIRV